MTWRMAASAEEPGRREEARDEGRKIGATGRRCDDESERRRPKPDPRVETRGRVKASPLARRIARERGIELSQVRGTGPDPDAYVAEDVEGGDVQPVAAAAAASAPSGEIESRPLTSTRKTIARRL